MRAHDTANETHHTHPHLLELSTTPESCYKTYAFTVRYIYTPLSPSPHHNVRVRTCTPEFKYSIPPYCCTHTTTDTTLRNPNHQAADGRTRTRARYPHPPHLTTLKQQPAQNSQQEPNPRISLKPFPFGVCSESHSLPLNTLFRLSILPLNTYLITVFLIA